MLAVAASVLVNALVVSTDLIANINAQDWLSYGEGMLALH